ncbi:MAG: hypothetical protein JSR90_22330 [Proteobacteria bacterium]|nr:hypothetical protein [Pseudomonadota bacterium]
MSCGLRPVVYGLGGLVCVLGLLKAADTHAQSKTERCMARVVRPTAAVEDPSSVLRAGEVFGPITQVQVDRRNGKISYCAHGDYCYPSTNLEFMSPCRIDSVAQPAITPGDTEWIYAPR